MSGQPGFFDDLATRGLNQLHTAMVHLIAKYLIPQKLASQVTPVTDEEKELARKQVFGKVFIFELWNHTYKIGV